MSDRKRNHEKREKNVEMEKTNKAIMDEEYMEMPIQDNQNQGQMQHNCPMMYQCPMIHQCPMMPQNRMSGEDRNIKDWFEEWDEFSEDSSSEFDDHGFYSPERYYQKQHKSHQYPYFWAPYFPINRK